jgi:benzylsuccinate CoA-transferase BbsE subunit
VEGTAESGAHPGPLTSAFDRFVSAGKRSVTLDIGTVEGNALFHQLLGRSDILIETWSMATAEALGLSPDDVAAANPSLVHVSVTPFGRDRPRDDVDDDDLTVMAAGGLLNLGGYPDSEPLLAYGGQSRNAASLFAAVAALIAIRERQESGAGRWIDVSAQECVAQALEDSVVTFEMTGEVRRRHGSDAAEAGTGMYPCEDGLVSMVAGRVGTARAWQALIAWLVESGVPDATSLLDPAWSDLGYRQTQPAIDTFSHVFGAFARTRTRLELYREAQRRGIALAPVNDIASVLADPQLEARGFWVSVPDARTGRDLVLPGPPYRLSATPALPAREAPLLGADSGPVLATVLGLRDAELLQLQEAGVS